MLAKGEHRLDVVIAVVAPPAHVERQVQLGVGRLEGRLERAQGAAVAGVRPAASLSRTPRGNASSALISAAFQAKRAS